VKDSLTPFITQILLLPTDSDLATSNLKAQEDDLKVDVSYFCKTNARISIRIYAHILSDQIEFKPLQTKNNKLAKKQVVSHICNPIVSHQSRKLYSTL